jgi:hypothetical protein
VQEGPLSRAVGNAATASVREILCKGGCDRKTEELSLWTSQWHLGRDGK